MNNKLEFTPLRYPAPLSKMCIFQQLEALKHLGVSPAIDNGIRYWRVIWRPFLKEPVTYRDANGVIRIKTKADNVKTERYAVVGNYQDADMFDLAVTKAREAYRMRSKSNPTPYVDWQLLALASGQKIRDKYAKPALNEETLQKAAKMFEKGASNSMVAKALNVDRSTASRWRKKTRS